MISSSREPALEMERGGEIREEKGREGWEETGRQSRAEGRRAQTQLHPPS